MRWNRKYIWWGMWIVFVAIILVMILFYNHKKVMIDATMVEQKITIQKNTKGGVDCGDSIYQCQSKQCGNNKKSTF